MPWASICNLQFGTLQASTPGETNCLGPGALVPSASVQRCCGGSLERKAPEAQGPQTYRQLLPLAIQGAATLRHRVILGQLVLIGGQHLSALLQALLQTVGNVDPEDMGQECGGASLAP